MGSECSCVKHDNEQEFTSGSASGTYKFKRFVCNEINKYNFIFIIIYNIVCTKR